MTREEIITALYTSKEITQLFAKIQPEHLREDLKQEIFRELCELPEDELRTIYARENNNGLRYYIVRITWKTIKSSRKADPFVKMFRQDFKPVEGLGEMPQAQLATQPAHKRHPLFGSMKGTTIIMPGVDLTQPADPDWARVYEDDYDHGVVVQQQDTKQQ